jgi:hypothetical protein
LHQVFKNKIFNNGTNSSPDLNQNPLSRIARKSFPTIYKELIKVRYMRPLETLHNNLCFKSLNAFLERMINERQESELLGAESGAFMDLESQLSRVEIEFSRANSKNDSGIFIINNKNETKTIADVNPNEENDD